MSRSNGSDTIYGRSKPWERCVRGLHTIVEIAGRRFCRWCGEVE